MGTYLNPDGTRRESRKGVPVPIPVDGMTVEQRDPDGNLTLHEVYDAHGALVEEWRAPAEEQPTTEGTR